MLLCLGRQESFINSLRQITASTGSDSQQEYHSPYMKATMPTTELVISTLHSSEHLLGQFLDESQYDTLVTSDCDCYIQVPSLVEQRDVAFKFRKAFFTQKEQDSARDGLWTAATTTDARGLATGPVAAVVGTRTVVSNYHYDVLEFFLHPINTLDGEWNLEAIQAEYAKGCALRTGTRGNVWLDARVKEDEFNIDQWIAQTNRLNPDARRIEAERVTKRYISKSSYANYVRSGIAGWYDRYPRIPYGRPTGFTQHHPELFEQAFPLLKHLSKGMKRFTPDRYAKQMQAVASIDSKFVIPETPFTTLTINRTFRTAAHRDAGDLAEGISNLTVMSNTGRYTGGYLVFPEIRVAVDVRPGDLLIVDNHRFIHGNTPIQREDEETERMSLVCYFREGMLELGSYDYEQCRYQFTQDRMNDPSHPMHAHYASNVIPWRGVSAGMWSSQEWYTYLEAKMGRDVLEQYHPEARTTATLDAFLAVE
jgi:hypothetical protein